MMSVCIFHNGNRQILEFYKNKFKDLTFSGNLAEATNFSSPNCLWEICFADANYENLTKASNFGIHIVRHISTYENDLKYLLPECTLFNYNNWLNFVVVRYISFADEIISDLPISNDTADEVAIITTGRTANQHFQQVLLNFNIHSFENIKDSVYPRLLKANKAILMWRENQWECLTSTWIAIQTKFIHNTNNQAELNLNVQAIPNEWLNTQWCNMASLTLDYAVFFNTVLKRPVSIMTTEKAIATYSSQHKPLNYKKYKVIDKYEQSKQFYMSSDVEKILNLLYNKVQKQLPIWKESL